MPIDELSITYDEIKTLVLEVLRQRQKTQYVEILAGTAALAVTKGIAKSPFRGVVSGATYDLHQNDKDRVLEIIWNLVIERILTMGGEGVNGGWPFFNLTSYGARVVEDLSVRIPHDPTGYLKALRSDVPSIDDIIITYLEECLLTYNINALLSSTIALGCASEKTVLLLIESFSNAISDSTRKAAFQKKIESAFVKKKFDEFTKLFNQIKNALPKELTDGIDITLTSIFEMIRINRNDAGHPTGKRPSREQIYASLQLFPIYVRKAYDLIEHFQKNLVTI